MSAVGLVTWIITAGFGLYLLSIWLIEYDKEFKAVAATRLPTPVLVGHVLAAGGGLLLWIAYLIWDSSRMAWYSVIALVLAASLGTTLTVRWISVYQAKRAAERAAVPAFAAAPTWDFAALRATEHGPPERNFPLGVVLAHGVFAVTTLALVLLTALGVGGS